jgi:hypothetical protein
MEMNRKEIENVLSLEPFERYKYFLKKVADSEKVYTLESKEGDWATSTVKEYILFPVWSANEFALGCAIDEWGEFNPIETNIRDFIRISLPEIEGDGFLLNVFPAGKRTGFVVKPDEFIRDISEELENYE